MMPFLFLVALSGPSLVPGERLQAENVAPNDINNHGGPIPRFQYCAAPWPLGSEGKLPRRLLASEHNYSLQQVQVIFRHGSRNADVDIEVTNTPVYHCDEMGKQIQDVKKAWARLFTIVDDDNETNNQSYVESKENGECEKSQLIQHGIQQHLMKGRAFRDRYRSILTNLSPDDVSAQSTPVPRTRASTAAFLSGVLGDLKAARNRGQFEITVSQNTPEDLPINKECNRSLKTAKPLIFGPFPSECDGLAEKITGMFNTTIDHHYHPSAYADVLLSDMCIQNHLPCGQKGCMTEELVEDLMACDQSWWSRMYTQPDHCMGAFPFFEEVVSRMNTDKRLVVYGNHDTGVMATACALDFSDGMRPRFASHIAFEVWKSQFPDEGLFVRIVYNGVVMTQRLRYCSHEMCPLSQFKDSIQDFVKRYGVNSFEEACAMA